MLEVSRRPPRPREVVIHVRRAGVALGDILRARGHLPGTVYPLTPGYDVAGEVVDTGSRVSGVHRGDRVAAYTLTGGYSQIVTVGEHRVVALPGGAANAEAVALVLNYVTARQMLHRLARVRRGEVALVQGAAGGVGTALLELGRLEGIRIYGTASAAKRSVVESLGAVPLDYRDPGALEAIRRAEPAGLDAVFESVSPTSARATRRLLRQGGTLVYYGFVALARGGAEPPGLMGLGLQVAALRLLSPRVRTRIYAIDVDRHRTWFREDLQWLLGLLHKGSLSPRVHATYPLERAAEAHAALLDGSVSGKIVLDCT
jgi:NADPH2:quinone reductase